MIFLSSSRSSGTRRRTFLIAALALGGIISACGLWAMEGREPGGDLSPAKLQQEFVSAGKAYDEGRPVEAERIYKDLLARDYVSKELLYNLGNACYKSGKMDEAILYFRRAWYLAPRDPDILANLGFAMQSAGVTPPIIPALARAGLKLSLAEWVAVGLAAYWGGAILLMAQMLSPSGRALFRRGVSVAGILLMVSLGGMGTWVGLYWRPEVVVIQPDQKALSGPVADAVALFAIPQGAIARQRATHESWIQASYDKQQGWIPSASCTPVFTVASLRGRGKE